MPCGHRAWAWLLGVALSAATAAAERPPRVQTLRTAARHRCPPGSDVTLGPARGAVAAARPGTSATSAAFRRGAGLLRLRGAGEGGGGGGGGTAGASSASEAAWNDDELEDIGLSVDPRALHSYKDDFRAYRPPRGHKGGPLDHIIGKRDRVPGARPGAETRGADVSGGDNDDAESDLDVPDVEQIAPQKDEDGASVDWSVPAGSHKWLSPALQSAIQVRVLAPSRVCPLNVGTASGATPPAPLCKRSLNGSRSCRHPGQKTLTRAFSKCVSLYPLTATHCAFRFRCRCRCRCRFGFGFGFGFEFQLLEETSSGGHAQCSPGDFATRWAQSRLPRPRAPVGHLQRHMRMMRRAS